MGIDRSSGQTERKTMKEIIVKGIKTKAANADEEKWLEAWEGICRGWQAFQRDCRQEFRAEKMTFLCRVRSMELHFIRPFLFPFLKRTL